MEGICGLFSSATAASWAEAGFTGLAAGIAVWVYWKSRRDSRRDKENQRAILQAMLLPNLKGALFKARAAAMTLEQVNNDFDKLRAQWPGWEPWQFRYHDAMRLGDIQHRLLDAGHAVDADIAGFIEIVRIMEEQRSEVNRVHADGHGLAWRLATSKYMQQAKEADLRASGIAQRLGIDLPER
jgi:hypothetical protein